MTLHRESKVLPFLPKDLYSIVADIESYPEFLPWISEVKVNKDKIIREKTMTVLEATLLIKFNLVKESFSSRVVLDPERMVITASHIDGPFTKLYNKWSFSEIHNGCKVCFEVDYQFKSFILHNLISKIFNRAITRVTNSFENRAIQLYHK